jgi:hypothetical protein
MRKGFPTFLILWFLLGPLMAALPDSDDAQLPACCRREGAHHCAMAAAMAAMQSDGQGASFSAPLTCPYFPGATAALLIPTHALTAAPAQAPQAEEHAVAATAEAATVTAEFEAANAGRAPPFSALDSNA